MMRRRALPGLAAAVVVLLAAACQPVTHPTFTVKEGPSSAVTAKMVSGDGKFVIVTATATGATVPSAGTWRVNRTDGSAVRLPDGYTVFSISRTGTRVLLLDTSFHRLIWSNGTLITPPGGATTSISADVTFGLFIDGTGALQRWEVATGTVIPVETGLPRPTGYSATPNSISDDGRIADFRLTRPCCSGGIRRFVDIAAHTATDVPDSSGGDTTEDFSMAAGDGSAFLLHHLESFVDFSQDPPVEVKIADWVELRDRASGAVRRHYEVPDDRGVMRLSIAADGANAWLMQGHVSDCGYGGPAPLFCVDRSEAVVLVRGGTRSFDTGGGRSLDAYSTTPSGRFLAYDFVAVLDERFPYGPTTIIDWVTGTVEQLSGSVDHQVNDSSVCGFLGKPTPCTVPARGVKGDLSDDGTVAVTTSSSGTGWYEYTPAPG